MLKRLAKGFSLSNLLQKWVDRPWIVILVIVGITAFFAIQIPRLSFKTSIYDLIIEMEADTMDKVKEVVFNKVRRLDNVKSTITLLTYGEPLINE